MNADFSSIVIRIFHYLISEYKFVVKKTEETNDNLLTGGRIEFESNTTFVTVSSDRYGSSVYIGRVADDKYYYGLDPRDIYEYLSFSQTEKQLICSFSPGDDRKAKMIIQQKRLLHTKGESSNAVENIESRLADYSKWLREYAEPFLRGDFSLWLEIFEFIVTRQRAERVRSGRDEFVSVTGRNKVSVFQRNLDYISKLKQEYGNE